MLSPLRGEQRVDLIASRSLEWLLDQRTPSGLWQFFNSNSDSRPVNIPPDADCTASALLSFLEWRHPGIHICKHAQQIAAHRHKGLFLTWILDEPKASSVYNVDPFEVDPYVNANVLLLHASLGYKIPEVEPYLRGHLRSNPFPPRSRYYFSAALFIYLILKLSQLGPTLLDRLDRELCERRIYALLADSKGAHVDILDLALTLTAAALSEMSRCSLVEAALNTLGGHQEADGGWQAFAFFFGNLTFERPPKLTYFGSRALTTAAALEAYNAWLR